MTPLPAALGGGPLVGWRLDPPDQAEAWDSGAGPEADGGRWSLPGIAVVYASLDPATAILESVVNRGVRAVRRSRPVLTAFEVGRPDEVRVILPDEVPDPEWLTCDKPAERQQCWGGDLLAAHPFVLFPSACSPRSWNLVFAADRARRRYRALGQERLSL